jgi:hypothetical protein
MPILDETARRLARRNQRLLLAAAAIAAALAVVLVVASFDARPSLLQRALYASVLLAFAGVIARLAREERKKGEPGLRVLAQRGADVVWIYVLAHRRGVELVVGTADGRRHGIPVPRRRADELLRETSARVPHAAVGYRPEVDATFRRDPEAVPRNI